MDTDICLDIENYDVSSNELYIVVDTIAFSTTVTTALESTSISEVHTLESDTSGYSFPTGGEKGGDKNVKNSPLPFLKGTFESDTVGLTSDNGAKRVHQLLDKGAKTIALGCLRNAEAVGLAAHRSEKDVIIVPADVDDTPVIEDYLASVIISEVSNGYDYSDDEWEVISRKASESIRYHTLENDSEKNRYCLEVNKTTTVPMSHSDGVFKEGTVPVNLDIN